MESQVLTIRSLQSESSKQPTILPDYMRHLDSHSFIMLFICM